MSGRLKIAFVNQPWGYIEPPIQTGGSIPIILYELSRRAAKQADVLFYTRGSFRRRVKFDQGVEYRYLPIVYDKAIGKCVDRLPFHFTPTRPRFADRLSYAVYGLQLARDLRASKVDIVHIVNISQFVPMVRRYNPYAAIVLQMECEWLSQLDPGMLEPRLAQADLLLGCSDFITDKIKHAFPHLADRCRTLYNGVDHEKFADREQAPVRDPARDLIFVGRVTPEKGVHTLIEAFGSIAPQFPDLRLQVIGPFEINAPDLVVPFSDDPKVHALLPWFSKEKYRAVLDGLMTAISRPRLELTGNLRQSDLPQRYRAADLCAIPSVWDEPFGIPLIEAMACGAPVVATRGGAFPEIVENGVSGLLVERGDAAGLAAALARLAGNPALRQSMSRAARQRVLDRFTWDGVASKMLDYFYEALAGRKSPKLATAPGRASA